MSVLPSDVPLSVFDVAPIVDGATARSALAATVESARAADELGYHRYWVAELHMKAVASAAPAVLTAAIAAGTRRIRVGSGGVMLLNHHPMVVAEQFGTLEALHPGRIDLGIGRAPGASHRVAAHLQGPDVTDTTFTERLRELLDNFARDDAAAAAAPFQAAPAVGNAPEVLLLATGTTSAAAAAELGLPLAFAHHLAPHSTDQALHVYRDGFRPSAALDRPRVIVSVSVLAADTDDRARRLIRPSQVKYLERTKRRRVRYPTPEAAAGYAMTADDERAVADKYAHVIVGDPGTVRERLAGLQRDTGADELMLKTETHDPADRRRSYELVMTGA